MVRSPMLSRVWGRPARPAGGRPVRRSRSAAADLVGLLQLLHLAFSTRRAQAATVRSRVSLRSGRPVTTTPDSRRSTVEGAVYVPAFQPGCHHSHSTKAVKKPGDGSDQQAEQRAERLPTASRRQRSRRRCSASGGRLVLAERCSSSARVARTCRRRQCRPGRGRRGGGEQVRRVLRHAVAFPRVARWGWGVEGGAVSDAPGGQVTAAPPEAGAVVSGASIGGGVAELGYVSLSRLDAAVVGRGQGGGGAAAKKFFVIRGG